MNTTQTGYTESEHITNNRYQRRWNKHCNILTARLDTDRDAANVNAQDEPPTAGEQAALAYGDGDLDWRDLRNTEESLRPL